MRRFMLLGTAALIVLGSAMPASAHRWRSVWWGVHWGLWWDWPGWYVGLPRAVNPSLTAVDTDISPERARVYLDGELIGTADDFDGFPDYLYLEPGEYTLEFRLKGYRSESVTIEAREGRFFPLDFKLERVRGEPEEPWYEGNLRGLPNRRVFGEKKPAPEPPERRGPDRSLRPETRGEPGRPPAARVPAGAVLDLRVSPGNAAVYLDGELVGTADELRRLERGLAVPPGRHEIEVLAPGKKARALRVDVGEGEKQQVVIELEDAQDEGGARQDEDGAL
ncbi:MAG TPA: hypothetical protein P5234_06250 [Thermoanaerobaculaceae bacterium]|nr:hypothetical protein [Thermoanaerobaculaceae bacterium]HRS15839.1 hypothetical protein [Thermoanaerobaculaceae bacterium]